MLRFILFVIFVTFFQIVSSGEVLEKSCYIPTKKEVTALFDLWNAALAELDSEIVASRYTEEEVLLATVSDKPRNTPDLIKDYFDHFLLNKPQGEITYSDPEPGCNMAIDMGEYKFTFGTDVSPIKARYTFVYNYDSATES